MKINNKENLPFIILMLFIALFVTLSVLAKPKRDKTEAEYWIEYYEAKLDWYEEHYNEDLDDTPNEFIEWLKEEYPETYEYLKDRGE